MPRRQQQQQRQQSLPLTLLLLTALALLGRVAQGFHLPSSPTAPRGWPRRRPHQMVLDPASVVEGVSRCVWGVVWA